MQIKVLKILREEYNKISIFIEKQEMLKISTRTWETNNKKIIYNWN